MRVYTVYSRTGLGSRRPNWSDATRTISNDDHDVLYHIRCSSSFFALSVKINSRLWRRTLFIVKQLLV